MKTKLENRGAIVESPNGPVQIADWQVQVDPEDLILAVDLCGLCGTDAHAYRGESARAEFPVLLGHEIAARVEWCPSGFTDLLGRPVSPGDRVAVASSSFGECRRCYQCVVLAAPWLCRQRDVPPTIVGGREVMTIGGGFARYVQLPASRRSLLIRIDAPVSTAVLHEPLSVAIRTVLAGPPVLGRDVVVQGTGPIGLLTVLMARAAGASKIIAVGGPAARLKAAVEIGASEVIDINEVTDPNERTDLVRSATMGDLGAGVVYEVAGVPEAVVEGLSYLEPSGVLVETGNASDSGSVAFDVHRNLQSNRREVIGVRGIRMKDFIAAARVMERYAAEISSILTHRLPLGRVADGLNALGGDYRLDGKDALKVAIDPFS